MVGCGVGRYVCLVGMRFNRVLCMAFFVYRICEIESFLFCL